MLEAASKERSLAQPRVVFKTPRRDANSRIFLARIDEHRYLRKFNVYSHYVTGFLFLVSALIRSYGAGFTGLQGPALEMLLVQILARGDVFKRGFPKACLIWAMNAILIRICFP